ncbi:Uncharacterised protein [Chromobacterium violaceum]|uniref:Uncharacterized protein n=1 Tax=Chromobacterium violaceum TaxID=536 RepID=A0A447T731_CHRVL|nr:Uncharacterised protein [Chromobacterium violaceum]
MSSKAPVTQAIRVLREHKVDYTEHLYKYEEKAAPRCRRGSWASTSTRW